MKTGNTTYNVRIVITTIMPQMNHARWSNIKSLPGIPVNCRYMKPAAQSHHYSLFQVRFVLYLTEKKGLFNTFQMYLLSQKFIHKWYVK